MKINKKAKVSIVNAPRLAGGLGAVEDRTSNYQELRRAVCACMLGEDIAYENGESVSKRIAALIPRVNPVDVSNLAIETRTVGNLRSVSLFMAREMAKHKNMSPYVEDTIYNVVQRADELSELLAMYWKDKKQPLSAAFKRGLAKAFTKFDEYALSKYDKDNKIKLRDVLFMCHAKPTDKAQENLWKRLVDGKLKPADTWERAISASNGEESLKKDSWERLLSENKLGALALIRNLSNFDKLDVDKSLVSEALKNCNPERVLPFRFITAVKHSPRWVALLESLMLRSLTERPKLSGKTVVLIDVSGSMGARLSGKSEMSRMECAASLCILLREVTDDVVFYATAGNDATLRHQGALIFPHRGFALRDAVVNSAASLGYGGIFLKQAMEYSKELEKNAERVIVITDEQDTDSKANPQTADAWGKKNYIINISVEKGGVAFAKFHHINGFSESVIDYITAVEELGA